MAVPLRIDVDNEFNSNCSSPQVVSGKVPDAIHYQSSIDSDTSEFNKRHHQRIRLTDILAAQFRYVVCFYLFTILIVFPGISVFSRKREYKPLKRLVHAMHIMPIHHVRRVYEVVQRSVLLGTGTLCLFSVFGVTFYMLYSFVSFLQTPSTWADNKLMSTVSTVQISQQKPVSQAPLNSATPVQLSKKSIQRLDNIIALACSGKATLSGIPIIGSPVGFALGAWIAYNNPDQG